MSEEKPKLKRAKRLHGCLGCVYLKNGVCTDSEPLECTGYIWVKETKEVSPEPVKQIEKIDKLYHPFAYEDFSIHVQNKLNEIIDAINAINDMRGEK